VSNLETLTSVVCDIFLFMLNVIFSFLSVIYKLLNGLFKFHYRRVVNEIWNYLMSSLEMGLVNFGY